MNASFGAAAALTLVTGLVHTVFGEWMIFRHLRRGGVIPVHGGSLLREYQIRILWATWHLVTVLGALVAALLAWLALPQQAMLANSPLSWSIGAAMLAGSALVCVGTKARHPGSIALLGVAILTGLGM